MICRKLYPIVAEWTPDRVKAVRKSLGQTQEQFAVHFRLHPEAIRTWEQGRGNPSGPATVILEQLENGSLALSGK